MEKLKQNFNIFVVTVLVTGFLGHDLQGQNKCNCIYRLIGLMDFNQGPMRIPHDLEDKNKITFFFPRDSMAQKAFKNGLADNGFSLADFEFRTVKTFDGESGPNIYSEKYKSYFDAFFHFKYSFTSYQKNDNKGHKVYRLKLKKSKFKRLSHKIDFLNGLFIRYGNITKNKVYQYKLNSSQHNLKIILSFIKDSGSQVIEIKKNPKELIPGTNIISFKPSVELKNTIEEDE